MSSLLAFKDTTHRTCNTWLHIKGEISGLKDIFVVGGFFSMYIERNYVPFKFLISYIKNTVSLHTDISLDTSKHVLYTHVHKFQKVKFLFLLHYLLYVTT